MQPLIIIIIDLNFSVLLIVMGAHWWVYDHTLALLNSLTTTECIYVCNR